MVNPTLINIACALMIVQVLFFLGLAFSLINVASSPKDQRQSDLQKTLLLDA
jgi:hypothetical protein